MKQQKQQDTNPREAQSAYSNHPQTDGTSEHFGTLHFYCAKHKGIQNGPPLPLRRKLRSYDLHFEALLYSTDTIFCIRKVADKGREEGEGEQEEEMAGLRPKRCTYASCDGQAQKNKFMQIREGTAAG